MYQFLANAISKISNKVSRNVKIQKKLDNLRPEAEKLIRERRKITRDNEIESDVDKVLSI